MFCMCNISAPLIFPLNVPILLLLSLKNGCISMGFLSGCEVCRIWAKLKISIVTFQKFDHFQCNLLRPPWEFYQIIQFFKYATSIPIYRHMPNLTMRDVDLHELELSVRRSDGVWRCAGTLCNRYRRSYPFSMLITFHYLAFVSHDSFLYLSAVVTCDNSSSSIFQTTTTYTLRLE